MKSNEQQLDAMCFVDDKGSKIESKSEHPWEVFLEARKKVITWMKEETNYDDREIAISLSMDEYQVYLINKHIGK